MPRVACVQSFVEFNHPLANAEFVVQSLRSLCSQKVDIAIFPECHLTGYCVQSAEQAKKISIPRHHPALEQIRQTSEDLGIIAVVGFAELAGDALYNSTVLFEPKADPRFYRKTHLPELGLDKFVLPGDEIPVFETRIGKIGILICFDLRHPEASRALMLQGADLVCLPTNWPSGAEFSASCILPVRAVENRMFFASANRCNPENGFDFIGLSSICDPNGNVLAAAERAQEVIIADCDFEQARQKRRIVVPNMHETTVNLSRRPELYGILSNQT